MSHKQSFHISDKWYNEIANNRNLHGWDNVYGAEAKTLQFGTTFTKQSLLFWEKILPDLEPDEMQVFMTSILNLRKRRRLQEDAAKVAKALAEVTPAKTEKVTQSSTDHVLS